jgi:para-aminobenzoate synthetase/4-amino-4-deoxychorismate lyase
VTQWHPLPDFIHTLVAEKPNSVLLQTARFDAANQTSHLFLHPLEILTANTPEDLPPLFANLDAALEQGHHAAGYLSYECGYHFEPAINRTHSATHQPLAWFGIYAAPITFDHTTGHFTHDLPHSSLPQTAPTQPFTTEINLDIDEATYHQRVLQIKDLITAGDTYQVNFTDRVTLKTPLPPAAAFATLIRQQPVSYAAFLNLGDRHILSLSPELFFTLEGDQIQTRPMKGTMPRGLDLAEDALAAVALQNDEKNRSEHIMIVDLLRNDLGRICTAGTVQTEDLFTVERYETLLQMTSIVTGTLSPSLSLYEIFRALFPSGSITGAPKIRTMQIIHDLESAPRGLYTGAIGHIAPASTVVKQSSVPREASNTARSAARPASGRTGLISDKPRTATFNVAIRTLILKNNEATMGVGGGIVADSEPADEYRECLLKASFLTRTPHDFQLLETILWKPYDPADDGLYLLPLHLDRLEASAAYFNFPCDRTTVAAHLTTLTQTLPNTPHRIRLLLNATGEATATAVPFNPKPTTGLIRLAAERTNSTDLFLRHKTTRRTVYDQHYAQALADGFDEVLFLNERGELTEGAISNLFLRFGDLLVTPPLTSGVLPGIYRRHLLETYPQTQEKVLTLEDLQIADAIYTCNSVRGLSEVQLA